MNRWFAIYVAVLLGVIVGLGVWGCFGLNHHLIVALDNSGGGIAQTAAKLDGQFGTIAETDKLLLALKSTTVHGDMVIAHEQKQLSTLDAQELNIFQDLRANLSESQTALANLGEVATSLRGTANAATGTLDEATSTFASVHAQVTPLMDAYTTTGKDLDAWLKDSSVRRTVNALADMSDSVAGISGDLHVYTHPILNPDPCKTRKCTAGRIFGKAAGYLGVAASYSTASQSWRTIPVRVAK